MKKIFKITSYILMAAFFSVALSGCGKVATVNPNANKVIVWSFEDEDAWKPVEQQFAKKDKNLQFVYQKQTFDSSYETRVLNSILAGTGPDVWAMPNDWVYRHKDQLAPMPDAMAKTTDITNKFVPALSQSVYFDSKIYALAPDAEPLMVYYNQALFDTALQNFNDANKGDQNTGSRKTANTLLSQVPTTWTDLTEAAKLITQKSGSSISLSGLAMGTDKISNSQDLLYLLMLQNQTKIMSENLQLATFNLPKDTPQNTSDIPGQRALEFYTSFANPANANYSWNDTLGNDIDAFGAGKVAMIFGYSSLQNTLIQKFPNLKYKRAFAPQLTQDASTFVDYAKFNAYGVSRLSGNTAAGWDVVNILSTVSDSDFDSALRLYTAKKASSYTDSIIERQSNNPEKLELSTAKSLVKGRYPIEFDLNIRNAIYAVNNGVQDAKSALDLAANNITELLRKTTW